MDILNIQDGDRLTCVFNTSSETYKYITKNLTTDIIVVTWKVFVEKLK